MTSGAPLNVQQTVAAIREGRLTVSDELRRVTERARQCRALNALTLLDEHAAQSDSARRAQHCPSLPLAGVPVVVKDNIDVAGMPTSLGTQTLATEIVGKNAEIIDRLQQAGAVIVAKAAMHELASGTSGLNAARGDTLHPFLAQHVVGGSSGGSAAAVAAGIVPVSIGTDTGASVRLPASFCGLAGFRPSLRTLQGRPRYPLQGIAPVSVSRDTPGIIARNVADIMLTDSVISGEQDIPQFDGFHRLRLGVPENHFWQGLDKPTEQAAGQVLHQLSQAGVTLVGVTLPEIETLSVAAGYPLASFELLRDLPRYLSDRRSQFSAEQLFKGVMSRDVQAILSDAATVSEASYRIALEEKKPRVEQIFRECFTSAKLDGLIFPTVPLLPPSPAQANGLFRRLIANCEPATIAGLPCISLPLAKTPEGIPVGIEIQFSAGHDRRMLSVALAIEQLFRERLSLPPAPPL